MHIEISSLGPHRSTALRLVGTIERPSEWGKSLTLDLALWALSGRDRRGRSLGSHVLRDDCDGGSVRIMLADGRVVERKMRPSGTNAAKLDGATLNDSALLDALGIDRESLLLIAAPHYWRQLADGPREGQAFRDALVGLLADDARTAEIVRGFVEDYDPEQDGASADKAKQVRRDRNRERDTARGRLDEAMRALQQAEAAPVAQEVSPDEVAAVAPSRAYHAELAEHRAAAERVAAWKRARAAITERWPDVGTVEQERAREATARRDVELWTLATTNLDALDGEPLPAEIAAWVETARRLWVERHDVEQRCTADAWAEIEATTPGPCDACGQLPPDPRRSAWRAARDIAASIAKDIDEHQAEGRRRLDAAKHRLTEARAFAAAARERAALGDRPTDPGPEPTPPAVLLTPAACERVGRLVAMGAGAAQARQTAVSLAQDRVTAARDAWDVADHRAARADEIVRTLELAPSQILDAALADLNARLDGERIVLRGPGADMEIDGRPWWLASTGRQIVADARLRLALRDMSGHGWLPVVADEAQSWSGAWPEGVVLLRTGGEG